MKKTAEFIFCLLFITVTTALSAQQTTKSATSGAMNNNYVFLQTDRSYYLPGETVFYKAFFLDCKDNRTFPADDTLQIRVYDQEGLLVSKGSLPVKNNIISGSVTLPQVLTDGNYILTASTRSMTKLPSDKLFSKIIDIRKSIDSYILTDISLTDTVYEPGETLTASVRFSGKDNQPIPAAFTYQLAGNTEEIVTGNNKANDDGMATLKFKLPVFDEKEVLKLSVVPSYKGLKNTTGVVIPTVFNTSYLEPAEEARKPLPVQQLNIMIRPTTMAAGQNDNMTIEIIVTDNNGKPAIADLSASASVMVQHQRSGDEENLPSYLEYLGLESTSVATADLKDFFTERLISLTQTPGKPYIVHEQNNAKKLNRAIAAEDQQNQGYSSDRNLPDIIQSIKAYHIDKGKIYFGTSPMKPNNTQDGALIVLDGIKMGTDASVLNTIQVPDIAKINVSTNTMDIQRYSALNTNGVIEIYTRKSKEFLNNQNNENRSSTLYWNPSLMTDEKGIASFSFNNPDDSAEVLVVVNGITATGVCGYGTIQYSVK